MVHGATAIITIVTFLWRGWRPVYTWKHVNAWARMVHAHVKQPHRCVCITDIPQGITGCETFPLWTFPAVWQRPIIKKTIPTVQIRPPVRPRFGAQVNQSQLRRPALTTVPHAEPKPVVPNSFVRLRLFDPAVARWLGDRLLCLDLDCVITADIDPLITAEPVRFLRGVTVPLNGSMWQLEVGQHREIWDKFDPIASPQAIETMRYNGIPISGSDQAWISMTLKDVPTWGPEDGVYQHIHRPSAKENQRIVFFAGSVKPWDCQATAPDLHAIYHRYLEA